VQPSAHPTRQLIPLKSDRYVLGLTIKNTCHVRGTDVPPTPLGRRPRRQSPAPRREPKEIPGPRLLGTCEHFFPVFRRVVEDSHHLTMLVVPSMESTGLQ
jgi:hypothetical protein